MADISVNYSTFMIGLFGV